MEKEVDVVSLFLHFLMLAAISIGGTDTVLPDMHRYLVEVHGWVTNKQFTDAYAIARAVPGPNMLYVTLLGWQAAGFTGALATTLALSKVEMLQLLNDAEFWELAVAAKWTRMAKGRVIVRENAPGSSFFFLAKGEAKVTLGGKLLNMVHEGECFGEMAYIRGGEEPRHATVEAMTDLVLAEFEPETLEAMSLGAQLHLTRALVRNTVDRLVLANTRITR